MKCPASGVLLSAMVFVAAQGQSPGIRFQVGIKNGTIRYGLSTPEEVDQVIGKPDSTQIREDGGMELSNQGHGSLDLKYGRFREWGHQPFVLLAASLKGTELPSPRGPLRLARVEELNRLSPFDGLRHTDLSALDLKTVGPALANLAFGSDTQWPAPDRMPPGFHPQRRLVLGENPGFGIRSLHARMIDGRGVRIAIIDQPILRDNKEYQHALDRVEGMDVAGVPPQMHASCVASIAVGARCGVAPGARLTFLEMATWKEDNQAYASALRRILAMNRECTDPAQKIRAVSISYGGFQDRPDYQIWRNALKEAEATGVLVLTCDDHRPYGTLRRLPEAEPDAWTSYQSGLYDRSGAPISVPTGGRTLAGHEHRDPYFFDPDGGRSWGAPYLLGLAALVCQINPKLSPDEIWNLIIRTTKQTPAGKVPDPTALAERAIP